MATLNENDLDGMAKKVVERFLSRQAALADAAADEAKTARLNPDQIERMVQSANTEAFLRMMDQRKQAGAGDLMHEFEPIDARHVIRIVIDQSGVHVSGPSGDAPMKDDQDEVPHDVINPAEGDPGHLDSPAVESCEEECHEDLDPPGVETVKKHPTGFSEGPFASGKSEKKPPKKEKKDEPPKEKEASLAPVQRDLVVLRMRKLAAHLASLRNEAEVLFDERFDGLVKQFRGIYKKAAYEEFEKSALVEHGDTTGLRVISMLRAALRMPADDLAEKRAALLDRHISDDTSGLRTFGDLCKIATNAARLDAGVEWIRERCAI